MDDQQLRQELQAALQAGRLDDLSAHIAQDCLAGVLDIGKYRNHLLTALNNATPPQSAARDVIAGDLDKSTHNTKNIGVDARQGQNTFVDKQYVVADSTKLALEGLLKAYYASLSTNANKVRLHDADTADPRQREVVLSAIYTTLEVARSFGRDREMHERQLGDMRQAKVFEALGEQQHVVLLGAPGSGKSTCVNFLVYSMAEYFHAQLNADSTAQATLDALEREGWQHGPRIPIWIILSQFASWLQENPTQQTGSDPLWAYLASRHDAQVVTFLREQTEQLNTLIIFDGLDEVPFGQTGPLPQIKHVLETIVKDQHVRVLVTCRTLDYQRDQRHLLDWPTERLIDFSPELQQVFIERWYTVLRSLERPMLGQPDDLCTRLKNAVRNSRDLQRLAGNPLLLTMMALLHASKGELPHDRISLYRECLDLLLRRWRRHTTRPALEEEMIKAGLPTWQRTDTDKLLNYLGFIAHSQIDPNLDQEQAGSNLDQDLVLEQTTRFLRDSPYNANYGTAAQAAEAFLHYIKHYDNGVLQYFDHATLRFPHRTFQEYLAASYLVDDGNWHPQRDGDVVTRLLRYTSDPAWREVLLLAVSKLVLDGRPHPATALVKKIASKRRNHKDWPEHMLLASELMLEAGKDTFYNKNVGESRLWLRVLKHLQHCINPYSDQSPDTQEIQEKQPLLPAQRRVHAARIRGQLLDPSLREIPLEPRWCHVPAGPFICGSDPQHDSEAWKDEQPQYTINLHAFAMAAHPVTNAEFGRFIDAGGYHKQHWWSEIGWMYLQKQTDDHEFTLESNTYRLSQLRGSLDRITNPRLWNDARFNAPDQPIVGISWFEAMAYCAWLSEQLSYHVTLPTEAQWEKAARGADGRIYPWGDQWNQDYVNCNDSFESTTPLGCFPQACSPYGCYDMIGNI